MVLVVVLVAFLFVVAVVALPLLLLPTGKPPKPSPGSQKKLFRSEAGAELIKCCYLMILYAQLLYVKSDYVFIIVRSL